MQYSLPPEEFLQQMRAESQYLQQYSTPAPQPSYTVTPQPQYPYNTNSQNAYEGTQASNHMESIIPQAQAYHSNNYQYNFASPNSYLSDNLQSTPLSQSSVPSYVSTANPSSQYVSTQSNTQSYVSSASPLFLSSQPSVQQYVSSPVTGFQSGPNDYSNRVTTASNSLNYDMNDSTKKLQIDHFDNGGNGIRYPLSMPQQYQTDISTTTQAPFNSTPYPEPMRDAWQNAINTGVNSLSKSLQEISMYSQYQNNENQQQNRQEVSADNINSETHRMGNVAAANNMYMNFVQPDYQVYNNIKSRTRDLEQEISQPEIYSHGDYGWKLAGKKSLTDSFGSSNFSPYNKHHMMSLQSENQLGQNTYQTEHYKQFPTYNYNPHRSTPDAILQNSKTSDQEAREFAKAAAKAQEHMKAQQQQTTRLNEHYYLNNYAPSYSSNNPNGQSNIVSTFYGNNDKHKIKYLTDNPNVNSYVYGSPTDLITASPYMTYASSKDADGKSKQPFDHAKALKNIVPIDVTNVVPNSEAALKVISTLDNNRYTIQNYPKEQIEQTIKQAYRPLADSYYKDKNTGYGFNIKSKPEDNFSDGGKQQEQNVAYYNKHNPQDPYNQGLFSDTKRYAEGSSQPLSYGSQSPNNYNNNLEPSNNIQSAIQRPVQQDLGGILKLNDIPYRFTQGLTSDALKLHNNNFDHNPIPQQIPTRINQNVGTHQLDVANSLLSKLLLSKQPPFNFNKPNDIDPHTGGPLSTIHGFRVANPYNVDLKLVAELLKGKPAVDETHMASLREQFNKPLPLKLDMSTLQNLLIKNDNYGNLSPVADGLSSIGNLYADPYITGRYPYQNQVKYSRSQEEEESIVPIAESSNTHPIGAVMEQDDISHAREVDSGMDFNEHDDDTVAHNNFEDNRPKSLYNIREHRPTGPRHPNSLVSGRHSFSRKYPKHDVQEPYPLLKPPPPHSSRSRMTIGKNERRGRRRRITKPKLTKIIKTEPMFEAESSPISETESAVPILLRPPPPVAEDKTDVINDENSA